MSGTTTTFSATGVEQSFTVPATGEYEIVADAGGGGSVLFGSLGNVSDSIPGGEGSEVSGEFELTKGETIDLIVAFGGGTTFYPNAGGGGGGGTYVLLGDGTPLEVAGAGGGAVGIPGNLGQPGGIQGGNGQGAGGTEAGGNAGGAGGAGGGAGLGGNGANSDTAMGGADPANGAAGGNPGVVGSGGGGGFGGGGGGSAGAGGGGGGYGGGAGGAPNGAGQGGTSFIAGSALSPTIVAGGAPVELFGQGQVTITEGPACFLRGTHIQTPTGGVAVEELRVGDMALTLSGAARRIVWVGDGRVTATRGRRNASTPVVVCKNALAPNVPHDGLRITKAHALFMEGALIPIEFLINHRSIYWDDHAEGGTFYHIELENHDVLIANGAPAESYRDDGNRWLFRNANSCWHLPPKPACAPVLTGGPVVDALWRRLLDRAGPRPTVPMTHDPDLHLIADRRRIEAAARGKGWHQFRLMSTPHSVRIMSRAGIPQELGFARDPRCLGIALHQVIVAQGKQVRTIEADDALLTDGFHGFECDNAIRWTNGDAGIPGVVFDGLTGSVEILLRLGGDTTYIDECPVRRAA